MENWNSIVEIAINARGFFQFEILPRFVTNISLLSTSFFRIASLTNNLI